MFASKKKKGKSPYWNDTFNSALTRWFALFDDDESSTSSSTTISYYDDALSCPSGSTTATAYSTETYDTQTSADAPITRTKARKLYSNGKEKHKKEARNGNRYKQLLVARQSRDEENDKDGEESFLECNDDETTSSKDNAAAEDETCTSNASSTNSRSLSSKVASSPKVERQRMTVAGTPLVNTKTKKVDAKKPEDDNDQETTIPGEIDIDTSQTETTVFEKPKGILNKTQSTIQGSKHGVDTRDTKEKKADGILLNRRRSSNIKVKKQVSFSFDNKNNLNNRKSNRRAVCDDHAALEEEAFNDPVIQALATTVLR